MLRPKIVYGHGGLELPVHFFAYEQLAHAAECELIDRRGHRTEERRYCVEFPDSTSVLGHGDRIGGDRRYRRETIRRTISEAGRTRHLLALPPMQSASGTPELPANTIIDVPVCSFDPWAAKISTHSRRHDHMADHCCDELNGMPIVMRPARSTPQNARGRNTAACVARRQAGRLISAHEGRDRIPQYQNEIRNDSGPNKRLLTGRAARSARAYPAGIVFITETTASSARPARTRLGSEFRSGPGQRTRSATLSR